MLTDSYNRKIEYLRFSVTDLCNLRCRYCMPLEGITAKKPHEEVLTFEEIRRMVGILADLGIRRVRLTGGEPLVRNDLPRLVRMLAEVPRIAEILLTTNGVLLERFADRLREAGLKRINIHLDTLVPWKFRQITRWGEIGRVLEGITAAKKAGFDPVKLNMVVQKGVNENEVEDLLLFASRNGLILRLIELMPIGLARCISQETFVPLDAVRQRLEEKYTLTPAVLPCGAGPAVYFRVKELSAVIGFISPVSRPFCRDCNRLRLSADGRLQDCLACDGMFSFRDLLRTPDLSDTAIARQVLPLILGKREDHGNFMQDEGVRTPCMYGIGG